MNTAYRAPFARFFNMTAMRLMVYDGTTALKYLESNFYDAAVLDIMMPGLDGISVLKQARAKGLKLPIIMLTAKVKSPIKSRGSMRGQTITSPSRSPPRNCSRAFAP